MTNARPATSILPGHAEGEVLVLTEPLSFWGGVDPASGTIIDAHHPQRGLSVADKILFMPTSRGSCSGSGVLLELVLGKRAPAALIFSELEDVLTLGCLIAAEMFAVTVPILRLSGETYDAASALPCLTITQDAIHADEWSVPVVPPSHTPLALSECDQAMLDGDKGAPAQLAMRIITAMARQKGAVELLDVTRGHVDGCIFASPANLVFAEKMVALGARVSIPTTMNAISVDHANWRAQGIAPDFGVPAQRLADCYVAMGCAPSFTCSPYLLDAPPVLGERIAWSESNAVIFANSVLGARTEKHPDFLDLCIAITARAPRAGVYRDAGRVPRTIIDIDCPADADDAIWPLVGYCAGLRSPNAIPLLRGLSLGNPGQDDLQALCAAFGTTSAAPMLHIAGVTPEADVDPKSGAPVFRITRADLAEAYQRLNRGPEAVELVAIGSPHASSAECRRLAKALAGRTCVPSVTVILTLGRDVALALEADGTLAQLGASGVTIVTDLCWCSIARPLFPVHVTTVLTNSGKYAHYGPGLSGCTVRFAALSDCVEAALTGFAPQRLPDWLA